MQGFEVAQQLMVPSLPYAIVLLQALVDQLLVLVGHCDQLLEHLLQLLGELFVVLLQLVPVLF